LGEEEALEDDVGRSSTTDVVLEAGIWCATFGVDALGYSPSSDACDGADSKFETAMPPGARTAIGMFSSSSSDSDSLLDLLDTAIAQQG
jgi:hypothetical protein